MKKMFIFCVCVYLLTGIVGESIAQDNRQRTPSTVVVPQTPAEIRQPSSPPLPQQYMQPRTTPNIPTTMGSVPMMPTQTILPAPVLMSQMIGKVTAIRHKDDGTYAITVRSGLFKEEITAIFNLEKSQILIQGAPSDITKLNIGDPVNVVYSETLVTGITGSGISEIYFISVIPEEALKETETSLKEAYDIETAEEAGELQEGTEQDAEEENVKEVDKQEPEKLEEALKETETSLKEAYEIESAGEEAGELQQEPRQDKKEEDEKSIEGLDQRVPEELAPTKGKKHNIFEKKEL
ncbi:MAG: hypothetical protein JW844_03110 [Candidatus Omnitrophica bacterium]|nr:hypothetical protein [Candidatus Omnitrophota bacterium]